MSETDEETTTPLEELRKLFPGAFPAFPFGAQAWLGEFTLWLSDHNSDTEWDLGVYDDEHLANGEPNVLLVLHPYEVYPTLQALKLTAAKPTQARLVETYCRIVRKNTSEDHDATAQVIDPDNSYEVSCEISDILSDLGWEWDEGVSPAREAFVDAAYATVVGTLTAERDSA